MNTIQKPKIQQQKSHIPRILLSLLLFLIIFAAQFNSNTLTAKAAEATISGTEWVEQPGEIYWGGSAEKQGILFYLYNIKYNCIDYIVDPFVLTASRYSNGEPWLTMVNSTKTFSTRVSSGRGDLTATCYPNSDIPYPATYTEDGTWASTGGDTKAYLEEELGDSGRQRWEYVVGDHWNLSMVDKIKKDRGETYRICMESVSAFVPYKNENNTDYALKGLHGDYIRVFNTNKGATSFHECVGVDISRRYSAGSVLGTANSGWLQSIANGMVFSDEEDSALVGVPTASYSGAVSSSQMKSKGYGFGTIKPILTPIHTCNGTIPGPPEEVKKDVTDGKCMIQKMYWTTVYDKDGNFKKRKDERSTYRQGTTNYIVIDSEEGYTVRKWSTNSGPINPTPENWKGYSGIHNGKGGGEIVMDEEGGEKYLAVWLEKVEVDKTPPSPPEDFLIEESQITRRISFEDSAKTLELLSHEFVFESAAPDKSYEICYANGGHLTCTNKRKGHNHSFPGCYSFCSGYSWDDNDTKLGIVNNLAKDSKYYSVLSKHQQTSLSSNGKSINSDVPEYNTKNNYASRGGTGSSTLTYPGFAYNCIIFRGKDQLVLADWKNAQVGGEYLAAKSFLGNIANDGKYNFKSANQPNGTRYKGDSYIEKISADFSASNLDTQTKYVPSSDYGCGSSTRKYTFKNSTKLKINDIIIKVNVYWGYKDKTLSDQRGGVTATGGSDESNKNLYAGKVGFFPYILMRYDNKVTPDNHTFVMGEFARSIEFHDAASYSINKTGTDKITILSSQWSTHASAISGLQKKFEDAGGSGDISPKMKESILPGGATLSLSIAKDAVRKVTVTTAQAYLPKNSAGYKQMMKTNDGRSTTKLPDNPGPAKSAHSAFANSVRSAFQRTYIKQYVSTKDSAIKANDTASILKTGKAVHAGDSFNGLKLSTDSKYYFNKYNESHLDVSELHHSESTVTFGSDSHGNLWSYYGVPLTVQESMGGLGKGGEAEKYIKANTNVLNQISSELLTGKGNDAHSGWGTQWYNEAFDGVTYIYQQDYFYVGLINPTERITVIDPKLTPKQNSKSDFFNNFHSSAFITFNPSNKLGTFRNAAGSGKSFTYNFNNLYRSKPFYIPNVTTQDLN